MMDHSLRYLPDADDAEITLDAHEALAVLEQFVVDNDELLELEERIGRFNIFDALGVARAEIRHSIFLAWLLDPNESHGQGSLFLKAILMDLLRQAPPDLRPLSPVELDGEELRGVEVRREWKNIDLLITCDDPPFVIVVENKIDSDEGEEQLLRYKQVARTHFVGLRPMFVFLTTDGSEPSEDDWVPYSYADIHRVLERVRRTGHGAIGDDVEAFLEHYLRLIGSRFMDDAKIDELCQRIYKNHRQAIDLIFERRNDQATVACGLLHELVKQRADYWHVVHATSRSVYFVPKEWHSFLPPIGEGGRNYDPRAWLLFAFEIYREGCWLVCYITPTSDSDIRQRVLESLTAEGNRWKFRVRNPTSNSWLRLRSSQVSDTHWGSGPDAEGLLPSVGDHLEQLQQDLAGVPDALRPIIAEWEKSHREVH